MTFTVADVAKAIDHTLLKPEATATQVEALIAEAVELGTYSVCVSPSFLPLAIPSGLKLAVVCGFPSGKHTPATKAFEANESIGMGADEVDMVIDIGALKAGRTDIIKTEIAVVRAVVTEPHILKVIIESAALTDDEIVTVCQIAVGEGADFVKTSTGFHPSGGASVHAVELMKKTVGNAAQVKASGGIRDFATAVAMLEAGATRLGVSGSRAVLTGAAAPTSGY